MKKNKIILHLCAGTGSDTKPYLDNGYDVRLVGKEIGVENFIPPEGVHGIIANPVCTELSTARTSGRARNPERGMFLVRECQRIIEQASPKWWVIENPATGALRHYLGKPNYTYQPWWYGSPWTKKTALWGNFQIPKRVYEQWEEVPKIEGLYIRPGRKKPSLAFMHATTHIRLIEEFKPFYEEILRLGNSEADAEFRSLCSQKFAKAFYQVNQ